MQGLSKCEVPLSDLLSFNIVYTGAHLDGHGFPFVSPHSPSVLRYDLVLRQRFGTCFSWLAKPDYLRLDLLLLITVVPDLVGFGGLGVWVQEGDGFNSIGPVLT